MSLVLPGLRTVLLDPPWTPARLPNQELWLAARRMAFTDNDPIGTAPDLFVKGDATQGTAAAKPTFKTGIVNGLPVMRFDGGDELTVARLIGDASAAKLTMYAVARRTGGAAGGIVGIRSASAGWGWRYDSATQEQYYHAGAAGNPTNTFTDQFNILEVVRDGLSVRLGSNGTLAGAASISAYTTAADTLTRIGKEGSGGTALTGDVAELILISAALATDLRFKTLRYLAAIYGIALSLAA